MTDNPLYKRAIAYLTQDHLSVIPVGKNKVPLIPWREFQSRFATPLELQSWFRQFPDMQLGIVTGKISNLSVVDVESGGDPTFLPQDTFVVKTGGGGWHYYFRHVEGLMNKARIKPLVDVRSEGGYVVASGSTSEKGEYTVLKKMPPATLPQSVVDILLQRPGATRPNGIHEVVSYNHPASDYPGYGQGERNDQMTRYIGSILNFVHPYEWQTKAWAMVQSANERNTPPLGQNELKASFESIIRADLRNNPQRGLKSDYSPENPLPQSPSENQGDEVKHIADVAADQKIDEGDVYPLQMPCFDELIRGGVSLGNLVVVAGRTGEGKTTLCQDWSISLMRGEKKAKVLWFSYEVLVGDLWSKFQEMGATKEDFAYIPAKHSTGNVAWVEQKIQEAKLKFGVKAVVIDHLGFLLPKPSKGPMSKNMSSNYATFLTQVVRDLKSLAIQEEVIIFLPVHMRKTDKIDQEAIKDSAGIAQESDLVFLIERVRNTEKNASSYFTEVTKITLSKNRKTGITAVGHFTMVSHRFSYNKNSSEADKDFDDFGKKEEKKEEVKAVVPTSYPTELNGEMALPQEVKDFDDLVKDALSKF